MTFDNLFFLSIVSFALLCVLLFSICSIKSLQSVGQILGITCPKELTKLFYGSVAIGLTTISLMTLFVLLP